MKVATLILAFVFIILAAYLYTLGAKIESLKQYKDYFWVPIPIGCLFLIYTFFQKDSASDEKG